MPVMGRDSIFRNKDKKALIRGITTKVGKKKFEEHRKELAVLAKRPVTRVSDGDVVEYLSRGRENTMQYLLERADEARE